MQPDQPENPATLDLIRRYAARRVSNEVVPNDRNAAAVRDAFATVETRLSEDVEAAYQRGLTEGRRQADAEAFVDQWAACPSCRTSGPAVGACEDRWHLDNLVGGPNRRFNAAIRELAGLFGARQGGKTTAARIVKEIYDAGEADGRRQARQHQPGDIEVSKSRSAGWVFRCHRCDITSANLDEHGARQRATDHLHLEAPELLATGGIIAGPGPTIAAEDGCTLTWPPGYSPAEKLRSLHAQPHEQPEGSDRGQG